MSSENTFASWESENILRALDFCIAYRIVRLDSQDKMQRGFGSLS